MISNAQSAVVIYFSQFSGLKKYSNWPTYPQVYVKGELIGGLDILKDLQKSGELGATLKTKR